MTHEEMIAVIRATEEHKLVEGKYKGENGVWLPIDSDFTSFNFADYDFRIKPESHTLESKKNKRIMKDYNFTISDDDIVVNDIYTISKKEYNDLLDEIESFIAETDSDCIVLKERSRCSLKLEMSTHTLLYNLGIAQSRTKDCDLNYPQKWIYKVGYAIIGCIGMIFNK